MKNKKYKLAPEKIKPIATEHGECFATDRITVDGCLVGYMYREDPDHPNDSGWRFFAGDESEEYSNDSERIAVYDVNTIANYCPDIVPLLDSPVGSAFERYKEKFRKLS